MINTPYIRQSKYNTYQYYRRVPSKLLLHTGNTKTFKVSLGDARIAAEALALEYSRVIDKVLHLVSLDILDEIPTLLEMLLPNRKEIATADKGPYLSVVLDYLHTKKDAVTMTEYKTADYTFNELLPALFKEIIGTANPKLTDIEYRHIEALKGRLIRLPKKTIQMYKVLATRDMIKLDVPLEHRLSSPTINRYMQRLRALLTYATKRGIIQINYATSIPTLPSTNTRGQRLPLSVDEYHELLDVLPPNKKYLLKVLAYTGMRLSELYKTKVDKAEGHLVFSLMNPNLKLKTLASYRIIPVHTCLLDELPKFDRYRSEITPNNLAATTSKKIKLLAQNADKKSLYSLRHTFATTLIQGGADSNMVSELLGHSHKGMTLSRYTKGYSIGQLLNVLGLLRLD